MLNFFFLLGHYIPELMDGLIDTPITGLNFSGVMIGNPYVDGGFVL